MNDSLLEHLGADERDRLDPQDKPEWISPMLATLMHQPFSNDDWLFERKFDGVRCLAHCHGGQPMLFSRNRLHLNDTYPELVAALAADSTHDYIVDGEIVAFRDGVTSFARLQGRSGIHDADEARASPIAVYYYLFDLLYLDGHRLTRVPLRTRKRLLRDSFGFCDPLRYTAHRNSDGEQYHQQACHKGWEGVIGKHAASSYVSSRSRRWVKLKCIHEQELVIGGYTDPSGSRTGFGALLLGYYEHGDLHYAGKVGTGFDDRQLHDLHEKLNAITTTHAAFVDDDIPSRGTHWTRPELVAEIGFAEWTDDGRLRHPRFLGLRRDKAARDVVREDPA